MEHSAAVLGTLDDLLDTDEHVVGYSGDELPDGGIRVYVDEPGVRVADEIAGRRVEVVAIGRPTKKASVAVGANPRTNVRPLIGGLAISGSDDGALGYFVRVEGKLALLSAAHVLDNSVQDVLQRAKADGGKAPQDVVAKLLLSVFNPGAGVDAAAAAIDSKINVTLTINDIGPVAGKKTAALNDVVRMSGPMEDTRPTSGTVNDLNGVVTLDGDVYRKVIGVKPGATAFSEGGDSGSLVLCGDKAIGILAGGTSKQDWVCDIDLVLNALNATLAT
jgi:hypothetical protein